MHINLTQEEASLLLSLLESIPVKGVESMKKVLILVDKLNSLNPMPEVTEDKD